LILPDFLVAGFKDVNLVTYSPASILYIFLIALLASLERSMLFIGIALFFVMFSEIVHFSHLAYFGGIIDADIYVQMFEEFNDVIEAAVGIAHQLYYAPLIVVVPYALTFIVFKKYARRRLCMPGVWIIFLGVLGSTPYKIIRTDNIVDYYPTVTAPSIRNSYLSLSVLFFRNIPEIVFGKDDPGRTYQPVKVVENGTPSNATIVILMGEGVASKHMSLFGYERETTPLLDSLRSDPNFVYKTGFASGINTRSSLYVFWNCVRDPRDRNGVVDRIS